MTALTPTPEQMAIIEAICKTQDSIIVEAYAGAAKTTTIELALSALNPIQGQVLALAFNTKIKKELGARLPPTVDVLTLNGLGHRAWSRALGKTLRLNTSKLYQIVSETLRAASRQKEKELPLEVKHLVEMARSVGLCHESSPLPPRKLFPDSPQTWADLASDWDLSNDQETIQFARQSLLKSIQLALTGEIDFADQIYMPTCFGGRFQKYPLVVIDEAQDLSPLNHVMLKQVASGRVVAVGDSHQAIYAFRGADTASMEKLTATFSMHKLALSTSFRCPKAVIKLVQQKIPEIQPAPQAKEGSVKSISAWNENLFLPGSAILCRNNAPLVRLAFRLLAKGKSLQMLGRDIEKGMERLLKQIMSEHQPASKEALIQSLEAWRSRSLAEAAQNNKKYKLPGIEDRAESLKALIEHCRNPTNPNDVQKEIKKLFENSSGTLVLATGHKAKGLEWNTVYHIDPWLIPNKYAKAAAAQGNLAPLQQDQNLDYVIMTRAKENLYLIRSDGWTRQHQL